MHTVLRRCFFLLLFLVGLMAQSSPAYRFDGAWPKLLIGGCSIAGICSSNSEMQKPAMLQPPIDSYGALCAFYGCFPARPFD
jgi:hypothetical protein